MTYLERRTILSHQQIRCIPVIPLRRVPLLRSCWSYSTVKSSLPEQNPSLQLTPSSNVERPHRGRLKLKEDEVKDEAPPIMSPPKLVGRNPIPVGDTDTAAHYSSSDSDLETVHIPISDTEAVHLTQAERNSIVKMETCLGQLTRDQLYEVTENSLEIPVDDHDPDRSVQIDAVYGSVQIEAVDRDSPTIDRGDRHFIGCLFHSKQSNRRYLLPLML